MLIAINKTSPGKPSVETLSSKEYTTSFVNYDIDIKTFKKFIKSGYAFCSALTHPFRSRQNFGSGQIIGADFDTGDEKSSFDYLIQNEFIAKYGSFLYTTQSHTEDAPRTRAVFQLSEPIYSANSFEITVNALLQYMDSNDPVCKDAARIFFGSVNCEILDIGNILPAKWFLHKIVTPYARGLAEKQAQFGQNIVYNGSGTYILRQKMNKILEQISNSYEGERNNNLNKAAFVLGGFVSAGYNLSKEEAASLLIEQAMSSANPLPKDEISRTVSNGLARGLSNPIFLNDPHADFMNILKQ